MFLCVALVSASAVVSTLVVQGAQESLRAGLAGMQWDRGVDLVVVPGVSGASRTGTRQLDLDGLLRSLSTVPGVLAASPQLFLLSLEDSAFCTKPEMFLVAFDPETDFTVLVGLPGRPVRTLALGEALAGSHVAAPPGEKSLDLAGYELKLAGHLLPAGSTLDQSLFVSFETARDMADRSPQQLAYGLEEAANNLPVVLVGVTAGSARSEVGRRILRAIPGVSVLDRDHFFQRPRDQMDRLLRDIPVLMGITAVLCMLFIGLVFSIAVNERRREIAVLRALGSSRSFVFRSLLAEALLLALGGGSAGASLSALASVLFQGQLIHKEGLPLASQSPVALLLLVSGIIALAVISTSLAALFPAWRMSRQEPAMAMRQ